MRVADISTTNITITITLVEDWAEDTIVVEDITVAAAILVEDTTAAAAISAVVAIMGED